MIEIGRYTTEQLVTVLKQIIYELQDFQVMDIIVEWARETENAEELACQLEDE